MRTTPQSLSAVSQQGLKTEQIEKYHFKACQCVPSNNMDIRLPSDPDPEEDDSFIATTDIQRDAPPPDAEMWTAMDNGRLMMQILTTFYTWVFKDEILKPYFVGVTKQRLIEKVYSFHYQLFTGEKVFFGERPKNAHHWMVISDKIFAHRQQLMRQALQQYDVAEHLIERWIDYEEWYRDDIIKSKPIDKVLFGKKVPHEGFESLVMEFSSLCDSCQAEINVGDTVQYHVRIGTVYCVKCTSL
jgi:truncated hemoglobin YjbI